MGSHKMRNASEMQSILTAREIGLKVVSRKPPPFKNQPYETDSSESDDTASDDSSDGLTPSSPVSESCTPPESETNSPTNSILQQRDWFPSPHSEETFRQRCYSNPDLISRL